MSKTSIPPIKVFPPEYYDKIFQELQKLDLDKMNANEIHCAINKRFQGYPIFVLTIDPGEEIPFYRITTHEINKTENCTQKDFSYNPKPNKLGRANLIGEHVFYGAIDPYTCLQEMKEQFHEKYYLSKWIITPKTQLRLGLLIANMNATDESIGSRMTKSLESQIRKMVHGDDKDQASDELWHGIKSFCRLFSESSDKFYKLSASIASNWFNEFSKKGADIPMILYPSFTSSQRDINIAIRKDLADSSEFKLISVTEFDFQSQPFLGDSSRIVQRGIPNDQSLIEWKDPLFSLNYINFDNYEIFCECGFKLQNEQLQHAKFNIGVAGFKPIRECIGIIESKIGQNLAENFRIGIKEIDVLTGSSDSTTLIVMVQMDNTFVQVNESTHEVQWIRFEINAKCLF